jgi:L-alanine-DL-glutamate epimerase-like enolase superfamily enzyme
MVSFPDVPDGVMSPVNIVSVAGEPLSVALREPFVIATGRMDVTRAVLVRAVVEDASGRRATGFGEAAALPPVTFEDQPDLLARIALARETLQDTHLVTLADATATVERALPDSAVARAGVQTAIMDAWTRLGGTPLWQVLEGGPALGSRRKPESMLTDITLPISEPAHMSRLAAHHRAAGFTCFKVKVGRDWRADRASLRAVAAAVPDARFRLDANAGFTATDALALLDGVLSDGLVIECYEQPCATNDLDGMAVVTARATIPVVADESFRGAADLDRLLATGAASAVNLKLAKLGGPLPALALARQARAAGLRLMAGAMVETRVGLLAMAHVVAALGGVDWVDLDTAFLLKDDPFEGGWTVDGARIDLTGEPGLGVRPL